MNQIKLSIEPRPTTGKGESGRIRRAGRVPAVVYGFEVEPTPVSVDAIELYHALHGPAGTNVLLVIELDGDAKLCVARDIQRHPVKGHVTHMDLQSVDKNTTIVVEVPIHLEGEVEGDGIVSQMLSTVPIHVAPLKTPNGFTLDLSSLAIGDVVRVEELRGQLPDGAEFDVDPERTVVTVNPPAAAEATETEATAEAAATEAAPADDAAEGDDA